MLITFEGIDASGKSTQAKLFADFLSLSHEKNIFVREPGGTKTGEDIRQILLHKDYGMFAETEFLLFSAARAQLTREVIIPALEKGYIVVTDRFSDSSLAYQGYGRGLDIDTVKQISCFAVNNLCPDMTFFIDIPVEDAIDRMRKEMKSDRIEVEGSDFFDRVRRGYLKLEEDHASRIHVIDGTRDVEQIQDEIREIFLNHPVK